MTSNNRAGNSYNLNKTYGSRFNVNTNYSTSPMSSNFKIRPTIPKSLETSPDIRYGSAGNSYQNAVNAVKIPMITSLANKI